MTNLVGPPLPAFKACFSAIWQVGISRETYLGVVGVFKVTYLLRMVEITSRSSFEPNNPTEQKRGYV